MEDEPRHHVRFAPPYGAEKGRTEVVCALSEEPPACGTTFTSYSVGGIKVEQGLK